MFWPRSLVLLPALAACDAPSRVETLGLEDAISRVVVKSGAGKIDLGPSEDGSVQVQVTLTGKGTDFAYKVEDGELTLKKRCGFLNMGVCEVDFTILAPPNVAAELISDSGSVGVLDWEGPLDVSTSSGAIALDNVSGNLVAETGSGAIEALQIGALHVALLGGSGEIELDQVEKDFEEIVVDNGSGDVLVYLPAAGTYDLTTDTGSGLVSTTNVTTSSNSGHVVDVRTGSGDITIIGQ